MQAVDRAALRTKLIAARQALPNRLELAVELQRMLRAWLTSRSETSIGAYWPIKGEFDPLPAVYRWTEGAADGVVRQVGLPVVDKVAGSLTFHAWYPGCPTELDAYDIPKPKGTEQFVPTMLLLPCLGYGPAGVRLGYGGGFYERTIKSLQPRPLTVGLAYAHSFQPLLRAEPEGLPMDVVITEDGVMWQR
ncbi:5-formyltetrahydrofolate cyclo-ligase [soil metagenome]